MRTRRPRLGVWWVAAVPLFAGLLTATVGGRMRVGGCLMAGSFLLAAGLRAILPDGLAGGLHIRGRRLDVLLLVGMAAVVLAAILAVDLGPARR